MSKLSSCDKDYKIFTKAKISPIWPALKTVSKDNKKGINLLSGFQSPVKIGREKKKKKPLKLLAG